MNRITLIHTYYNDDLLLQQAIEHWNKYTTPVSIILIDDGSQKHPAIDVLKKHKVKKKFSLYAVESDIGFNSHGCRNLGAAVSKTDWILFLDIDHFLEVEDLEKLSQMNLDENYWYSFVTRHRAFEMSTEKPSNTFMCTKKMYEEVGGYDEYFTPYHWGDREFLAKMEKYPRIGLDDIVIRCERGGRKTFIDRSLEKPVYDNEKLHMYHPPLDLSKIQPHDLRLNFSWKKLI